MANMMNKGTAIVGFVLSFVTGAGFMYAVDRGNQNKEEAATADKAKMGATWKQDGPVPLSNEDPVEGNVNAPVTIVEFSDFQ